jgi:hypothetical protein
MVRRENEGADVILFEKLGAALRLERSRRSRARRRPARADAEDQAAEPVEVTRVTVIPGEPLEDTGAAQKWLSGCRDPAVASAEVESALRLVNRAIQAYRVSAADPYAGDVARAQARRVRLGFGSGDELVEGRWRDAVAVPLEAEPGGRRRMLAPQEQLAGILSGRREVHPSEDMLLRARADLDQGRAREAALQTQAALAALNAELQAEPLRAQGEVLSRLGNAALEGVLDDRQAASLDEALTQIERVVRRRRHSDQI